VDLYVSLRHHPSRRIAALRDDGKRVTESPWLFQIVHVDAVPRFTAIDRGAPEDRGMSPSDNQPLDVKALDVSADFAIDHVAVTLETFCGCLGSLRLQDPERYESP
jgi:hypothetical protein